MAFNTRQHGKEQQLGLPRKSISMIKHKWWLSDLGACVWRASVVSDFTWGEEMGRRSGEGLISLFSPDLLRVEKQIGDLLPLHVHRYAGVRRERRREREDLKWRGGRRWADGWYLLADCTRALATVVGWVWHSNTRWGSWYATWRVFGSRLPITIERLRLNI